MNLLKPCVLFLALMLSLPFLKADSAEPQTGGTSPGWREVSMHDLFYHTQKTLHDLKKDGYRIDFPDQVIREVAEKLENRRSTTFVLSGYVGAFAGLIMALAIHDKINPSPKSVPMQTGTITSALAGIATLPLLYYKWNERWYQKKLPIVLESQSPVTDEEIKNNLERVRLEIRKKSNAILGKSVFGLLILACVLLDH